MITVKTEEEIALLREGGRRLARILDAVAAAARPGVSAAALDRLAQELAQEGGDRPAFLRYRPDHAPRPYPASLCVSINDEVVHGIPNEREKKLREGDIVSLDMGLIHKKLVTDMAVTVPVGKVDAAAVKLLAVTKDALAKGIRAVGPGVRTGDIGYAIESFVRPHGYGIVRELAGHGVGYAVHEDPYVPNYGRRGEGPELRPGTVIAIEPMLNEGSEKIVVDSDGYTCRTADGKRSAHFECTVAVTDRGALILTRV